MPVWAQKFNNVWKTRYKGRLHRPSARPSGAPWGGLIMGWFDSDTRTLWQTWKLRIDKIQTHRQDCSYGHTDGVLTTLLMDGRTHGHPSYVLTIKLTNSQTDRQNDGRTDFCLYNIDLRPKGRENCFCWTSKLVKLYFGAVSGFSNFHAPPPETETQCFL